VLVLIFNKPPAKTDKYEVVRPEEWTGKESVNENRTGQSQVADEWPMLRYIDIADSLRSNIVVVVFYSIECDGCYDAIPLYDRMSRDMAGDDSIRFAFVEVPPYTSQQNSIVPVDTLCLRGRLDSNKEWYIKTPLIVVVHDGSVVKSWETKTPGLDEILDVVFAEDK
jgi:thiol-disulfide isomerase/thioredoxin